MEILGENQGGVAAVRSADDPSRRVLRRRGRGIVGLGWVAAVSVMVAGFLPSCDRGREVRSGAVLFLGDSLTARHRLDETVPLYPEILGGRWGREVLNFSSSGLRAEGAWAKFGEKIDDLPDEAVAAVFLALGANDQLAGRAAEEALTDLQELITRLKRRGWEVFVIQSIVPFRGGGYADAYQQLARITGRRASRDIVKAYLRKPGGAVSDNVHPSADGHRMIAETLDQDFGRVMKMAK